MYMYQYAIIMDYNIQICTSIKEQSLPWLSTYLFFRCTNEVHILNFNIDNGPWFYTFLSEIAIV